MAASEGTEYAANQGSPDQLPQGAAETLNEAMPAATDLAPEELQPAPAEDGGTDAFPDGTTTGGSPEFQARGMDEEMLFLDPEQGQGVVQLPSGRLPDSVVRMLPYMAEAASDPNAPESLRTIYAAVVNSLDAQLR